MFNYKLKRKIIKIPGVVFVYKKFRFLKNLPGFILDLLVFKKRINKKRFKTKIFDIRIMLQDKTLNTSFEPHYIYHPAWAGRYPKH